MTAGQRPLEKEGINIKPFHRRTKGEDSSPHPGPGRRRKSRPATDPPTKGNHPGSSTPARPRSRSRKTPVAEQKEPKKIDPSPPKVTTPTPQQAAKNPCPESSVTRARLQPGRKSLIINVGASAPAIPTARAMLFGALFPRPQGPRAAFQKLSFLLAIRPGIALLSRHPPVPRPGRRTMLQPVTFRPTC